MKKIATLIIGILFFNSSFGQEIEIKDIILDYKFVQNGQKLRWKELVNETESKLLADLLIKKAKSHNCFSNILALVGGKLTGIPVGLSISAPEPNWT